MPKIAYSYIRFSSKKQELGQSLSRQAKLSADWCDANGATLDTTLKMDDKGVSGLRGKNLDEAAALGGFINAVKQGRVPKGSYLLVESLDRLSRMDIDSAFQLFREILKLGVNIVTLQDNKVFTPDSLKNFQDIIISIVIMQRAHEESMTKSFRLQKKWEERRKNLKTRKIATRFPSWLTLSDDRKSFTPIPSAAAIINKMFSDYSTGIGVVTIAKRLNESGVPCISNRSKIWKTHYIQQLLRSRALIGEYQPKKRDDHGKKQLAGVAVPDYFPVVVPVKLFDKVQYLLGLIPPKTSPSESYGLNVFSGKLFCPYCGERMFVAYYNIGKKLADGTKARYGTQQALTCVSAKNGRCINIGWPMEDFREKFIECSTELRALYGTKKKKIAELVEAIEITKNNIAARAKASENILKAVEEAEGDIPEYAMHRLKSIEGELKQLRDALALHEQQMVAAKGANPYSDLGKIDLNDANDLARLAIIISTTISKIHVFFAGSKFNYSQARSIRSKLQRAKTNPTAIAFSIRKKLEIEKQRFFVVHLASPGLDRRLTYPKQEAALGDFDDLPDDAEPITQDTLPPKRRRVR